MPSRECLGDGTRTNREPVPEMLARRVDPQAAPSATLDAIRDAEVTMGEMGAACSKDGLATSAIEALKSGLASKNNGM